MSAGKVAPGRPMPTIASTREGVLTSKLGDLVFHFMVEGGSVEIERGSKKLEAEVAAASAGVSEARATAMREAGGVQDASSQILVARDNQGQLVGLAAVTDWERSMEMHVEYLGTNGKARGAGAALLYEVVKLTPTGWHVGLIADGSEGYFRSLGFHEAVILGNTHEWSEVAVETIKEMEVVPEGTSRVIAGMVRNLRETLRDDQDRSRLPRSVDLKGIDSEAETESKRMYVALDWGTRRAFLINSTCSDDHR